MRTPIVILTAVLALTGCGSNTDITRDCCYQGAIVPARFGDLVFTLGDGSTVLVSEALPGLRARPEFGGARYPVREIELALVVESAMSAIFSSYDANRSKNLEQPEITVLYLSEAARGLDVPVDYVGDGVPITAIDTSAADIMGIVRFVADNREGMNRTGQRVFAEMDSQRDWMRTIYAPGGDRMMLTP
jgi:hypothetical protein